MGADPTYLPGANEYANKQVQAYEATDGAEESTMKGVPTVILTTRGRRSGALRKTPLMRVTDGEKYAVIASKGGAPEHPVWYLNLLADPTVTVQDKAVRGRYGAHTATGAEREQWWDRAVAVWPDYESYRARTDREIPVVVLEPLDRAVTE
jgi:deazaflavin-dependent oxidoreductase (nitroreductase family)